MTFHVCVFEVVHVGLVTDLFADGEVLVNG